MWFQACHLPSTLNSLCVAILSQLEWQGSCARLFFFATCTPHQKAVRHSSVVVDWHKAAWPLCGTRDLCSCCWGLLMLLTCWWTVPVPLLSCWVPGSVIYQVDSLQVAQAVHSSGDGICPISQLGRKLLPPVCGQWCNSVSFGDSDDGVNCFRAPGTLNSVLHIPWTLCSVLIWFYNFLWVYGLRLLSQLMLH